MYNLISITLVIKQRSFDFKPVSDTVYRHTTFYSLILSLQSPNTIIKNYYIFSQFCLNLCVSVFEIIVYYN